MQPGTGAKHGKGKEEHGRRLLAPPAEESQADLVGAHQWAADEDGVSASARVVVPAAGES